MSHHPAILRQVLAAQSITEAGVRRETFHRRIARRALLGSATALAMGCRNASETSQRRPSPAGARPTTALSGSAESDRTAAMRRPGEGLEFIEIEFEFPVSPVGPEKAMVLVPRGGEAGERYPVLVALHGRGEAVRGADVGARGWVEDYDLRRTLTRLRSPPLTRDDFQGFADQARLALINASLNERPFRGLIVVCPWVPDVLNERERANLDASLPFGRFVVEQLLPRVVAETPALAERAATGVDGVSLGGRAALVVGLANAERFGAVGTLQAALHETECAELVRRARSPNTDAPPRLRLVTSDRDYFRGAIAQLHLALDAARIEHEYLVIPGPHDYAFNRGPGGIEMLLWHDRVLRGEDSL